MIELNTYAVAIKPLALFIFAISAYSIFIFKFYHFLAKRDILNFNFDKFTMDNSEFNKFIRIFNYILEYLILTPIAIIFWFFILTVLLSLLAKNQSIETIMLISMSVVGTIRVVAHYDESLSTDLSKMLPFALLGVFLVDISFVDISVTFSKLLGILDNIIILFYYLIFIVSLELFFRLISLLLFPFIGKEEVKGE